ncbi:MAG: hypothetical protein QG657_827 [Acidobacteriota bacterium]|nr:hypothetical protein [Acidobacteriota bacterium]
MQSFRVLSRSAGQFIGMVKKCRHSPEEVLLLKNLSVLVDWWIGGFEMFIEKIRKKHYNTLMKRSTK